MGFLKKFFRNVFHEGMPSNVAVSSFEQLSQEELEAHLQISRYGDFQLTDALRPSFDLKITPRQGYRHDAYRDEENRTNVPVLMASASAEVLLDVFMDLVEAVGREVDVVIETSHHRDSAGHADLYREQIDMPVLKSILWDFEDLLLNDGCTGIAVLNPNRPQEVQFDEHKLLVVYGSPLERFEAILERHGLQCDEEMQFLTEAEHVHSSNERFVRQFDQLKMRLGMDGQEDAEYELH
ncbi:MAG: hypothetical protein KY475_26025 [Planctomycetes bacterium]|nr:hypothetical protein [Planctomycetota bacterium]